MMRKLHKCGSYLAVILFLAAVAVTCPYWCRLLLPQETQTLTTQPKRTNAQLMVINEDDTSRFYPRMAAATADTLSVEVYFQKLVQRYREEATIHSEGTTPWYDEWLGRYQQELAHQLGMAVHLLSGCECADTAALVSLSEIEPSAEQLLIRDKTIRLTDGRQKTLSLVLHLPDSRLLYYRLSDTEQPQASSAALSAVSRQLVSDINDFMPAWNKLHFPYHVQDLIPSDEADAAYEEDWLSSEETYRLEQQKMLQEQRKLFLSAYPNNVLSSWMACLFDTLSSTEHTYMVFCDEEETEKPSFPFPIVTVVEGDSVVSFTLPFLSPNYTDTSTPPEYHVYSAENELMVVFDTTDTFPLILYYNVTEGRLTGFST